MSKEYVATSRVHDKFKCEKDRVIKFINKKLYC